MRTTLLHNPTAGGDPCSKHALLAALREAGYDATCESAEGEDLAERLRDPGELVVVAGGDGTVAHVARRLVGRGVPLAVLPLGTANNIAKSLGARGSLPELSLPEQIARWSPERRKAFDVGVARGLGREAHFLEAAGLGLFPRVMAGDEENGGRPPSGGAREKLHRDLSVIKGALTTCRAHTWQVRLDGRDLSGRYLLLEAMNIPFIGPNVPLAPAADPGDELLDIVLLPEERRGAVISYLTDRLEGREAELDLPVHQGRHVRIAPDRSTWGDAFAHVDDAARRIGETASDEASDEASSSAALDLEVKPHALEFLVPE